MKVKFLGLLAGGLIFLALNSVPGQAGQPPVVSVIPDQAIPLGTELSPVLFTVWDPQNSPVSVVAACSNTNLVPSLELRLMSTDSSGTNTWSLTLVPSGVALGTATISLQVTDGVGFKATAGFTLTVSVAGGFHNASTISIPEGLPVQGMAGPYPSVVQVRGSDGVVDEVELILLGLTHGHPEDLDMLLVSPDDARAVMLMAHAGFGAAASGLCLTFSDSAAGPVPSSGALASQSYRPADYSPGFMLPAPAPPGPYSTNLSSLAGLSPNGDWKLYILDEVFPTGGTIENGWVLVLRTRPVPTFSTIGPHMVRSGGTIGPIDFQVSSAVSPSPVLTVSARSDNQALVSDTNIVITPGSGVDVTNRAITLTANAGTSGGTATITLTASDGQASSTTRFLLTILPAGLRPTANPEPIAVNDLSPATPYPSVISVAGYRGRISKLAVGVRGFSHPFPSDVGMLLVGPAGQKVVLMNNAGGGHPGCSQVTLSFDSGAPAPFPLNGPVISGTYAPMDHSGGGRGFQDPAPASPYLDTLDALNGADPNGTWSLYVEDFALGDFGVMSNGWALDITTAPVINGLSDLTFGPAPSSQSFTVADDSPLPQSYQFTAVSDNQSVVSNGGIVITAKGTNGTVTVTPIPCAAGSANITVFLTDEFLNRVSAHFKVVVQSGLPLPWIAPVPDQAAAAGGILRIPLVYGAYCMAADTVKINVACSNTNLLPLGNVKLEGTNLVLWSTANLTGSAQVEVTATSLTGLGTNIEFELNILPSGTPLYANSNAIVINDNSPASPYPSTIDVAGLGGNITRVTATFLGMRHDFPSDVSAVLVGPQGQKVLLMSRAGGSLSLTNTWLRFDDSAPGFLPAAGLINDGAYRPTDYKSSDTFFRPAPPAPYALSLGTLNGTNPNGTWSLYVQDDLAEQAGIIAGGWLLQIETDRGNVSAIPAQTTPENQPLRVPFAISAPATSLTNIVLTATSTNESPAGLIEGLIFNGFGAQRSLLIAPKSNFPSAVTNTDGTCTIVLTFTDGIFTNSVEFALTVLFEDQPPIISGLSDQTTPANIPLNVSFTVNDVDTPDSNLLVSASVSSELLGNLTVNGGAAGSNSLTYWPSGISGTNAVRVAVSDGTRTNNASFLVVSTPFPNLPPLLSVSPDRDRLIVRFVGAARSAKHFLQRSDDLNLWIDVAPISSDAAGEGGFDMPFDATAAAQFYRVRAGR